MGFVCDSTSLLDEIHSKKLNWGFFVPLIFSTFFFVPYLHSDFSLREIVICLVGYALFVLLYIFCRTRSQYAHWYIAFNAVLVIALTQVNYSAYSLIWFSAYFAGYLYPPKTAIWVVVVLLMALLIAIFSTRFPFQFYLVFGTLPCIALGLFGGFDRRIKREEAIKREKNRQIEQLATIAERERLARDMHDVLGHNLTALTLKSQLAVKYANAGNMEDAVKEINEVATIAGTALTDVRQAITQYKQKSFSDQLEHLVQQLKTAGFSVESRIELGNIDSKRESSLILITTEAVTNILRHSNGNKVKIELNHTEDGSRLSIYDNGSLKKFAFGNGLNGIKSRVEELQGKLNIKGEHGFMVEVAFS